MDFLRETQVRDESYRETEDRISGKLTCRSLHSVLQFTLARLQSLRNS
jgi:hypothetical protein